MAFVAGSRDVGRVLRIAACLCARWQRRRGVVVGGDARDDVVVDCGRAAARIAVVAVAVAVASDNDGNDDDDDGYDDDDDDIDDIDDALALSVVARGEPACLFAWERRFDARL